MKNLLSILLLVFTVTVIANPVEYYEEHLSFSTPVGEVSLGRSLVKGGWVYGYDFFNIETDDHSIKGYLQEIEKTHTCAPTLIDKCNQSVEAELQIFAAGKGVKKITEIATCDVHLEFYDETLGVKILAGSGAVVNPYISDVGVMATNCKNNSATHYVPSKNQLILGLNYKTQDDLNTAITKALQKRAKGFYSKGTLARGVPGINFTGSLLADIYDPETQLTYSVDTLVRHISRQQGEKISIDWDEASIGQTTLVPNKITRENGDVLLDIETLKVSANGFNYTVPIKMTDYENRVVEYTYDDARLTTFKDPMGNVWTYTYENFNPESQPLDTIVRLSGVKDPQGNTTTYSYTPGGATINGYKTAAGEGYYRLVTWQKDKFGKNEKVESKIYHSGRVEERLYGYGATEETPIFTEDAQLTSQLDKVSAPLAVGESASSFDPYLADERLFLWMNEPKFKWVYISYGGMSGMDSGAGETDEPFPEIAVQKYAKEHYGIMGMGGETSTPANRSNRTLKEVRINGETIYSFTDEYENKDGTEVTLTTIQSPLGYRKQIFKYFDDYSRASIPGSAVIIKTDGMEDKRLIYNEYGYVSKIIQGDITEEYLFDAFGNKLEETYYDKSAVLSKVIRTLDAAGNVLTETYPAINETKEALYTFAYDEYQRLIKETDAKGYFWEFKNYHVSGENKLTIDPRGMQSVYTVDNNGNVLTYTDPKTNTYTYTYNKINQHTKTTYPDNTVKEYSVDADGYDLSFTDQLGSATNFQYNELHQVTSYTEEKNSENSPSRSWKYKYNYFGDIEQVTEAAGHITKYKYDLDQLQSIEYPTYELKLGYDVQGNVNQRTWITNDNVTRTEKYGYDKLGRLTQTSDSLNNVITKELDGLGRIKKVTDATGGVTQLTWDARENLIEAIDPENRTISFEYNENDWLIKETRHNGETRIYAYYPDGLVSQLVDAKGQVTKFDYDDAGNLTLLTRYTSITETEVSNSIGYEYDQLNRLVSYDDESTSGTYRYNDRGDMVGMTVNYGPFSKSHSYDYYPNRNLKSYTNPEGIVYTYTYTQNNDLQTVLIPGVGQLVYNEYEWLVPNQLMFPGGAKLDLSHDGFSRLTGFTLTGNEDQALGSNTYTLDTEHNVTAIADQSGSHTLEYSKKHELTKHQVAGKLETYQYDGISNRVELNDEQWIYNDNDQLIQIANRTFEYDQNGSLVKELQNGQETKVYTYNLQGRLTKITEENNVVAEYGYGPFGHRLWKTVNGITTYFHYNQMGLSAEYDATGNLIAEYHYAPAMDWSTVPQFTRQNGQVYFYQNEYRNAPERIIDQAGKVVWQASYSAFGEATISIEEIKNPLRLPGQYFDPESNYHYNFKRYYDPALGRYLREDPLGVQGSGLNFYAYANVNPFRYKDATGEVAAQLICFAITAANGCPDFSCLIPGVGKIGKGLFGGRGPKAPKPPKKKPCKTGCFTGDTQVAVQASVTDDTNTENTAEHSTKSIRDIRVGDQVLAKNVVTGEQGYKPVVQLFSYEGRGIYELTFADSSGKLSKLEVTDDHPFWVTDFGWMDSIDLVPGLNVDTRTEEVLTVVDLKFLNKFEQTYNFEVSDWHTYFVGDAGVLVHNTDEPCDIGNHRKDNRDKGIPDSALGPSGKPKIHVTKHSSRKKARDAAGDRSNKSGRPEHHNNPTKNEDPHFHPEGSNHREHHTYPPKGFPRKKRY